MQFSIKKLLALRYNKTVQNGALFSIFSFLNAGISFVLLIIIAGFISPDGYGKINLFNTTVQIFTYFICLNTSGIISVVFFRKDNTEFKRTINTVLVLTIGCFLVLTLLLLLINERLEKAIGLDFYFQWIALWICLFQTLSQINLNIFRIEEKVKQYGIYSVTTVILNFVLTILLVVTFKYDWKGQIYAQVFAYSLLFAFSVVFLVKKNYITLLKPNRESLKEALSFGVPLIPHSATPWLRQGLDRYFIHSFHSTADVGLFSMAMNFANIITMFGNAFNQTNSVYIFKNLAVENQEDVKRKLRKQTILLTVFFIGLTVGVSLLATLLIPIIFQKYEEAVKYIPFLCLGGLFKCIYLQFCNYLFYYKKTVGLMYITFSCSLLHTALSFCLTRYSIVYTTMISAVVDLLITVGVFLYSRKWYKVY
ncbi:MAG: oligosaccharide flippase family protein [Bacteroidales bacterium]|nr:oligosaccharide flippase family protein [Bacteroidales bacterium]